MTNRGLLLIIWYHKIIYSDKYLKGLYDRFYGTNADGTPMIAMA